MRLVQIVEEVGLRDGEHYGTGWAVPFHAAGLNPQRFRVSSIFSMTVIPEGVVCLVATVGTHEVVVQADMIVPGAQG